MREGDAGELLAALDARIPGLVRGREWRLRHRPVEHDVLRGLYLERSQRKDAFHVWAFVQPLYVPAGSLVFTIGERVRAPHQMWVLRETSTLPDAAAKLFESYDRLATPAAIADSRLLREKKNVHVMEAQAYSLLACGRVDAATAALVELADASDGPYAWQQEMRDRARGLSTQPHAASQLNAWAAQTAAAIGVERRS